MQFYQNFETIPDMAPIQPPHPPSLPLVALAAKQILSESRPCLNLTEKMGDLMEKVFRVKNEEGSSANASEK